VGRIVTYPHRQALGSFSEWLVSVINRVEIERTCRQCGGTGEIEITRERRLDELTNTQLTFMFNAWLEREKAKWGGEDSSGHGQSPRGAGSMPSRTSMPRTGSPPVRGNTGPR